jgi:hypothetical protein
MFRIYGGSCECNNLKQLQNNGAHLHFYGAMGSGSDLSITRVYTDSMEGAPQMLGRTTFWFKEVER